MLKLRQFDLKAIRERVPIPSPRDGWRPSAYGGVVGKHFFSASFMAKVQATHWTDKEVIGEVEFEEHILLSILEQVDRPDMIVVECGAGWGSKSLSVTTAVRHQVVETAARSVYSYAVEACPGHYAFVCETFLENRMSGLPLFGAISDLSGFARFRTVKNPADSYGQSLQSKGNIEVPCFTLDQLVSLFKIDHVDLLHMDIQGAEPGAIRGGLNSMPLVRFIIVCPHYARHVGEIAKMLCPTHNLIVSFYPASGIHEVAGFDLPVYYPQDGVMVWEKI